MRSVRISCQYNEVKVHICGRFSKQGCGKNHPKYVPITDTLIPFVQRGNCILLIFAVITVALLVNRINLQQLSIHLQLHR